MRTSKLEVERLGPHSVITRDRLRVDVGAEFHVRVEATEEGVATAAQALAGKTFRASDLAETLEGKLVDAVLSVAAGYTMESLQDERAKFTAEVGRVLGEDLARNGLLLESVSLTRLDQTPFHALDENNAFNALGMRRLAEIIAANKKERAAIESDAEVSVRQSQLGATKQKLLLSQEEEEATIARQREIETARAASQADIAEEQSASERRREAARIAREREVRLAEIERDRELRRQQIESDLSIETAKADSAVKLAAKRIEQAGAGVEAQVARAREAAAEEQVQTARETAVAERERSIALLRAAEQSEVDGTRVRSEAGTLMSMAEAEAQALLERAKAEKDEMLARAEGTAALIEAENRKSPGTHRTRARSRSHRGAAGHRRKADQARREDRVDPHQPHQRTRLGDPRRRRGRHRRWRRRESGRRRDAEAGAPAPGREETGPGGGAGHRQRGAGHQRLARFGRRRRDRRGSGGNEGMKSAAHPPGARDATRPSNPSGDQP